MRTINRLILLYIAVLLTGCASPRPPLQDQIHIICDTMTAMLDVIEAHDTRIQANAAVAGYLWAEHERGPVPLGGAW